MDSQVGGPSPACRQPAAAWLSAGAGPHPVPVPACRCCPRQPLSECNSRIVSCSLCLCLVHAWCRWQLGPARGVHAERQPGHDHVHQRGSRLPPTRESLGPAEVCCCWCAAASTPASAGVLPAQTKLTWMPVTKCCPPVPAAITIQPQLPAPGRFLVPIVQYHSRWHRQHR